MGWLASQRIALLGSSSASTARSRRATAGSLCLGFLLFGLPQLVAGGFTGRRRSSWWLRRRAWVLLGRLIKEGNCELESRERGWGVSRLWRRILFECCNTAFVWFMGVQIGVYKRSHYLECGFNCPSLSHISFGPTYTIVHYNLQKLAYLPQWITYLE